MPQKLIPPQEPGDPEIYVFDSQEELQAYLGYPQVHGLYDSKQNKIYATWDSLAHEIAHYKDQRSGRFRNPDIYQKNEKTFAHIRNEAVAILYAWQKSANPDQYLSFEKEFLEIVYFALENEAHSFGELKTLRFSELQDLADWLCQEHHIWAGRLKHLFSHYEHWNSLKHFNFLKAE